MALEYAQNAVFKTLMPVLEDYASWFGQLVGSVAYLDEKKSIDTVQPPKSFEIWLEEAQSHKEINAALLGNIRKTHDEMIKVGAQLMAQLQAQRKPSFDDFSEFKNLYEGFVSHLRRLEMDNAAGGSGMDEQTGLRHAKAIESDLKKEMERLSRQGNPFSMVTTRIDRFAGQPDQTKALSLAVKTIQACMRSFDDAYYLGNGQFLLSLKHADIIGAQAAVNRIQQSLKNNDENQQSMTMSYCMAEPVPGDEVSVLLANMNRDLSDHMNETDAVLKFKEVSELERYVQGMESK